MGTTFTGKQFTFTQPDGSTIQLRGWGNQYDAVFETMDGYTVVKNPATGFFEVARVSADGTMLEPVPGGPRGSLDGARAGVGPGLRPRRDAARARALEGRLRFGRRRCDERREQHKAVARAARALGGPLMAPPRRGTVGDFVGLCLLIDFSDAPATISRDEVERFCNQPGYSGFGNNGSVSDYYKAVSIGRCNYTNVVAPYYRAQHPKSYYTDPNIAYTVRARQLILEALAHHTANHFDFTPLTADDGGFVYAMNVYYAGDVVNNWSEGLWPHASSLATKVPLAPGKAAFDYQFTDMGAELTLGTFCHENGHMLCDYPDLYDYGNESGGVGGFCLMCAGANISEKNPTHVSAYLKRLSGWANSVTAVQHGQQLTLAAGTNDFALFAKNSREYFLIENRAKAGRDAALPDEGLAIWHVDEDGNNSNEQMTPALHYELSLEQADGNFRLERSRSLGDATDLYGQANRRFANTTTPDSKWWDGTASNLDVFDISAPGPTVTFRTALFDNGGGGGGGGGGVQTVQGQSTPGLAIPDNRPDGVTDAIAIGQAATIATVKVTLDITHTFRGDLQVTLMAPWGAAVVLQPRNSGGSADDIRRTFDESDVPDLATFRGHGTQGIWRLLVQDLAAADVGTLNRWALEFATAGGPQALVVLEEAPGTHIPDNNPAGIQRTLTAAAAGTVGGVEVSVDIAHPYVSDLRVTLRSPAGAEVVLHDRAGGSGDNVVTTYTAATTAALGGLAGQPIGGAWRLSVSDLEAADQGKLNSWRVVIQPAP